MSWEAEKRYRDITFYFQVKERRSKRPTGITVSIALAEAAATTPVFVIRTSGTVFQNEFSVCVLHRWLLKNTPIRRDKPLTIPIGAFSPIEDSIILSSLLREEAARVSGLEGSPWRAPKNNPYGLAESEIIFGTGSLWAREPTEAVIRRVQQITRPSTSERLFHVLAALRGQGGETIPEDARRDPVISRWLERIDNPRFSELKNTENRVVHDFAVSVEQFLQGDHYSMPKYTWKEVNTWRILLGVYPTAFDLIEKVLLNRNRWTIGEANGMWSIEEIKASIGLLGAAACSPDEVVSERARALVHQMVQQDGYPTSCRNEDDYGYSHAIFFALAQADERHLIRAKDFLFRNKGRDNWEFLLNRRYYDERDDSALRRVVRGRMANPRRRDRNLIPLAEIQLELVEKYGVMATENGR